MEFNPRIQELQRELMRMGVPLVGGADGKYGDGTHGHTLGLLKELARLRADADSMPPTVPTGSQELRAIRSAITDHRLDYAEWSPDEAGTLIKPELIIIHYTVSQTKPGVVATFRAKDYLSVHLCIGVDGSITQMVPFNQRASHAGESSWKGRPSCNSYAIGIELVNPGPVMQVSDGKYVDTNGHPWLGGVFKARHKNKGCRYDLWAIYSPEQIAAAARACVDIAAEYGIKEIVGHDDVSPGRKIDPGPAWDWPTFLGRVFPS